MKKALLLSVVWLLTAAALRAAPANATFASEGGVPFQLIFDGQPQQPAGARGVRIDRLTPGFHWAEFLIPNGAGRVITLRTRVVLDGGLENSYVLLAGPDSGVQLRKVSTMPIRRGYSIFDPAPYGAAPAPAGAGSRSVTSPSPGWPAYLLVVPQPAPFPRATDLTGLLAALTPGDARPAPPAAAPQTPQVRALRELPGQD